MNRYPNLVSGSGGLLSARGNGFLRCKWFPVAGTFEFDLPADLPTDENGLIRVMGFCIGGGAGGNTGDQAGTNAGGAGGGFSQKELWVPPNSTFDVIVGAAGPAKITASSTVAGGTSSITINSVSWQATGGQNTVGGQGSGGDINTNGGDRVTAPTNLITVSGSAAGSPWGDGATGDSDVPASQVEGGKWRVPNFWGLADIYDADGFLDFEGIGMGGGSKDANGPGTFLHLPTFGGGGAGGWQAAAPGAAGLAVIYY